MRNSRIPICLLVFSFLSGCVSNPPMKTAEEDMYERDISDIKEARTKGSPVIFSTLFTNSPNSAGGVTVRAWYYVLAEKSNPIKYITMEVVPYNRVDDLVESDIDENSKKIIKSTGPYSYSGTPDDVVNSIWPNVWYNRSISCAQINWIEFEFMDGSIKRYDEDYKDIMTSSMEGHDYCGGMPRYKSPSL